MQENRGIIMTNSNENISENEIHYNSLISFFKHLVWVTLGALSIVSVTAGVLLYQDRQEMRNDLNDVKDLAEQAIINTTDSANNQIYEIRSSAERIALNEARLQVKEVFQKYSIKAIADSAAKEIVLKSIRNELKKEVGLALDSIKHDLTNLGNISDAALRMRIGLKSGLIDLQKAINTYEDDYLRNMANNLYADICEDYDRINTQFLKRDYPDSLEIIESNNIDFNFQTMNTEISNLIEIINNNEWLNQISVAFVTLRVKTGIHFEMFNIDQVNDWWLKNKYQKPKNEQN